MDLQLTGRRALVTGASGHVGKAVAEVLLELGATVMLTDRDPGKLGTRAHELGLDDNSWISGDLTREPDMSMVVRFSADRMFGPIDVLCHCAALTGTGAGVRQGWAVPFEYQSVEAFRYSLDVNLVAPFVFAQELKEDLRGEPGVMLLFGSIYGLVGPQPSLYAGIDGIGEAPVGYSAAKGGVVQLTRHLATILAPSIRCNSLVPGGLSRGQPAEFVKRYSERTPLGRMGTEGDLKGSVAYLVSDMSAYVTGQTLVCDGGFTSW